MYEERTLFNKQGKEIGTIFNKNMYKTARNTETYFVKYKGFGISKWVLEELKASNVLDIFIYYYGKNGLKVFYSQIEKWEKFGVQYVYKDGKNIDNQFILATDEMKEVGE